MKQRHTLFRQRALCSAASTLFALGLAGCGGSGGDDDPATQLRGVVATGAPLAGATVTVHDADAATADVTVTTDANGAYVADVSQLRAPLFVVAEGSLNGSSVTLEAVVPTLVAASDNAANVTPLTSAVAVLATNDAVLTDPAALAAVTASQLANASALVVNTLRSDPAIAAALGTDFDPLTTAFSAGGTGVGAVLGQVEVTAAGSTVSIANLAAPIGGNGAAPPAAVLTPALVATPGAAPPLPASSTDPLPTAARLRELAAKLQACLALPVAQRVTMDAAGTVSAVSPTCDVAPANWRSNGRNWVEQLGQFTLKFDSLTGAVAAEPVVEAVFGPANYTGTTIQNPVCNVATCVVVRMPMTARSGRVFSLDFVLGVVGGAWDFVGNQRPYNVFVEHRLTRKTQINAALAAANPTSYFANSRVEATLRLIFDPSIGNTANVRAVRWRGPGLPAAGVVMHRSERCGTEDRFAISNQEGLQTVNNSSVLQVRQPGAAGDFVLSAAKLDGSPLAMPVPTGWATTASPANQEFAPQAVTAAIPAYSIYTAELFHFGNNTDVADEVAVVRTGVDYRPASVGAVVDWPSLSPATIDAYLKPTGAGAGAITTLAPTLAWTNPPGSYVGGAYLFGQNRVSATNVENETANHWKRGRLDFNILGVGNESAVGLQFADPRSSVSLSPVTASSGPNPNPRCTDPYLEPLDGDASRGAYREIGITFRGPGGILYNDVSFWSN